MMPSAMENHWTTASPLPPLSSQRKRRHDDLILRVPPSPIPPSTSATTPPATPLGHSAKSTTTLWSARRILPISSKRIRTSVEDTRKTVITTSQAPVAVKLTPCHICHRRPTKKSDLESFMDCEGCAQRACYICMRRCAGWPALPTPGIENSGSPVDGEEASDQSFCMEDAYKAQGTENNEPRLQKGWLHERDHCEIICSRCCVEKGLDGDVVCLGCLAASSS